MKKYKLAQSKRKASALVFVLFAVVLLSLMGAGSLRLGLNNRIFAIRNAQQIQARTAADAGLTKAVFLMNEKVRTKAWSNPTLPGVTNESLPNCNATFSYKINANSKNSKKDFRIQSIGTADQAIKTVAADIGLKGLFDYAILTKETMILKSDTLIDGYNSLDAADTDADVKIGTISILPNQIDLKNGMVVKGGVLVGVDGNPDTVIKDTGGTTGNRYAMTEEPPFPQITPPVLTDKGGAVYAKGTTLKLEPSDSGKYTNITLEQLVEGKGKEGTVTPAKVEINGGDVVLHITGDIRLANSCEIIVKPGSSLTIYADRDITCDNNSGIINETGTTATVKLYGTGVSVQDWDIKAKSEVFGAVYAPNADIVFYAKGDIRGSVISNNFEFKAGGDFYYDEALRDVDLDDDGVRFVIKRWREY